MTLFIGNPVESRHSFSSDDNADGKLNEDRKLCIQKSKSDQNLGINSFNRVVHFYSIWL